nr:HAMP domain-containing sensor histidine kinase [Clostridium yunnanense]
MEGIIVKNNSFEDIHVLPHIIVQNDVIIEVNKQFSEMVKYKIDEFIGKKIDEVFNVLRVFPKVDIKSIEDKKECFIFTKNLEVRIVTFEIIIYGDKQIFIVNEKPYSRFEDKHTYLMELSKSNIVGVAVYSVPDMILIKGNQKYLDFLEPPFNNENFSIGSKIETIITRWKGSPIENYWKEAISKNKTVQVNEYKHVGYKRGITYWDSIITPITEEGIVKYVVSNTYEVTEKVLNRNKIQEQIETINLRNKQMEAIFENIPCEIYVNYKNGDLLKREDIAKSIGVERAYDISNLENAFNNQKYYTLDRTPMAVKKLPSYRALKGEKVKNERLILVQDGIENILQISSSPIYDGDNNILMAVTSVHDITELISKDKIIEAHHEAALKAEKEKNEALEKSIEMKDEFLSLISHELRTPLNVISSAIQSINYFCGDELSDRAKKYIGMINQNSNRQLRLVNNLLDITRANSGNININKKDIDIVFLTRAITESVLIYAYQKNISLIFQSSIKEKVIGIDDEKYERIILNILSNAIKFTPKDKSIKVQVSEKDDKVFIKIEDEGIGIPKDKLDIIFERFGQVNSSLSRQAEGAGIGLSLVTKFVEAMNGTISVESKVGEGSTFTIIFPADLVIESNNEQQSSDFMGNHLVQISSVEFSDIYF